MASKSGAVWAIDIGNNSLKALHLSAESGTVEVIGFDNIQHGKILTGSGIKAAERDELIALSLRQFVKQHDLGKDEIVVSVPSQNSFARFVSLPPVESKRIPEIVKFEAAQQIPFDINDVQWDWQLMTEAGSPETRVGIFAIKNEAVTAALEHFSRENLMVSYVQMAPMALYNYVLYDRLDLGRSDNQAIVVLNIGAENTDLVVCTKSTVWQRSIPMGGNAFTRAIADAFKLNFEKAEKLKRAAPMSKYARQVFQAMRSVFTDLASEVQRSLGFYKSSNPNTRLSKVIALGGGTKMRGLLKYLQQTLQIPIERPDSFKKLAMSSDVSAAKFHENVCDFGIVYGLALQGLGLARIQSNLLPRSIARSMVWADKAKYFVATACMLLLVSVLCFARTYLDRVNYENNRPKREGISNIVNAGSEAINKLKAVESKGPGYEAMIEKEFGLFKYRDVIPLLHQSIISALPNGKNNDEQKELYKAFAEGDVETVKKVPRKERKQIFITGMSVRFTDDIALASFVETGVVKTRSSIRRDRGKGEDKVAEREARERWLRELQEKERARKEGVTPPRRGVTPKDPAEQEKVEEEQAGFVVTITGFSPYKSIGELIDPVGVEDDPNKWGFVTRLLHLDDIVDGNSPFKLYERADPKHFKLEKGEVDLDIEEMPAGMGLRDVRFEKTKKGEREEQILIDPMTNEIVNKVAELDENGRRKIDSRGKVAYEVNDHWFRLKVKFIWKDAPKKTEETEDTAIGPPGWRRRTGIAR